MSAWNEGPDLRVESFLHHVELADPEHLTRFGWVASGLLWQRRFSGATRTAKHTDTAAAMLTDAIRTLGVEPDHLGYHGSMAGRGHVLRLDLPGPGLPRLESGD